VSRQLQLHHIGMLVKDVAVAAKMYIERFGYELKSGAIHDPVQGAYVQFVKLHGDTVYLEFICPDSAASKLSNPLSKGEGIHHLCYATQDSDSTCADLRAKGMSLVRAPVSAVAFGGRRIAWLMGRDRILTELVEAGSGVEI
jgi:methylmalonyl-CoA/ethylmalonyl-CoA epimerase